ncbi:RHS repeat-associated core domain-containing protein [Galbibacter mesophilus]|uniref:RHS repeat-associated core domain-containing protein n=1 Tax=Galbibacter mesophilus TaxID=379069 RepID=UPI0019201AF7|nr:RHS repeat-associated core domain-containing protein [Galbibacter mesophilus]MCM5662806.1 RHS repeat-associated core domain-containing protein [Galbibacter mesophilus]
MISSLGNSAAQRWKYNGKEYDGSLNINTYDFGARNYDPALGRWMNIDPLSEDYLRHSTYSYVMNNPLSFIDPDGKSILWKPEIKENGSVTYIAEKGDSAKTLSSQYGISQDKAEEITGTTGDTKIAEGTEVSGQEVKDATGSEILRLDLMSKEGKSEQRRFDQFVFARDHATTKGEHSFLVSKYYSNRFKASTSKWTGTGTIDGTAFMKIDGENIKVHYSFRLADPSSYMNPNRDVRIGVSSNHSRQYPSQVIGPLQEVLMFPNLHPRTGGHQRYSTMGVHTNNSNKLDSRFDKKYPPYEYFKTPKPIKN